MADESPDRNLHQSSEDSLMQHEEAATEEMSSTTRVGKFTVTSTRRATGRAPSRLGRPEDEESEREMQTGDEQDAQSGLDQQAEYVHIPPGTTLSQSFSVGDEHQIGASMPNAARPHTATVERSHSTAQGLQHTLQTPGVQPLQEQQPQQPQSQSQSQSQQQQQQEVQSVVQQQPQQQQQQPAKKKKNFTVVASTRKGKNAVGLETTNAMLAEVLKTVKEVHEYAQSTLQQQAVLIQRDSEGHSAQKQTPPTVLQLNMLTIEVEALSEENTIFRRKLIELGINPVKLVREATK